MTQAHGGNLIPEGAVVTIGSVRVCLVLPACGGDSSALATAIVEAYPDHDHVSVWAGDPQRRTVPPLGRWIDGRIEEPSGSGWNRLLVALRPDTYAWARAAVAVADLLDVEPDPVLVVMAGSIGLLAPLDRELLSDGCVVTRPTDLPADGLAPSPDELAARGAVLSSLACVGPAHRELLRTVARLAVGAGPTTPASSILSAAFPGAIETVPASLLGVSVVGWTAPDPALRPRAIDVSDLERSEGWFADFDGREPRHQLVDDPSTAQALRDTRDQWEGRAALVLPGAVEVDEVVRRVANDALAEWRRGSGETYPDPFDAAGAFRSWLETPWPPWGPDTGRYWRALWEQRPDLIARFPRLDGDGLVAFASWASSNWALEGRSPLLRPGGRRLRSSWVDAGREPGGINLVGYLATDKSLGGDARRTLDAFRAAGVPVAPLAYRRSGSPATDDTRALTEEVRYDTNLLIVNADQVPYVASDHGDVLLRDRYTIGYWFWDVEYVPRSVVEAARFVDEIWVATTFTSEPLRAAIHKPVRVVPLPMPEPEPSTANRADLGLPDERFVFLATLDHLSVTDRKNPVGVVEAFRQAYPEPSPDGPVLVVKTINRHHRWIEHERIRVAAAGRPDIVVVDRHLTRGDQMALIAAADCLVSLHRSEGLGLHLMEAMWLRTPTIATRYSGNLSFMDDENSLLVDAGRCHVARGEGYFPPQATWADPDLDQAAASMRRMVDDPELARRLAAAARATMEARPGPAEAGRTMARLAMSHGAPTQEGTD